MTRIFPMAYSIGLSRDKEMRKAYRASEGYEVQTGTLAGGTQTPRSLHSLRETQTARDWQPLSCLRDQAPGTEKKAARQ